MAEFIPEDIFLFHRQRPPWPLPLLETLPKTPIRFFSGGPFAKKIGPHQDTLSQQFSFSSNIGKNWKT